MATSSLQSDLTCSVCLELYKDPLQLKCMHSFCRDCLQQISTTNVAAEKDVRNICNSKQKKLFDQQAGKVFECPDCRYVVRLDEDGVDGLPKNFTLRNIVENFKKTDVRETKSQFPCAVCVEEPPREGVKFCRQCCICYCEVCLKQLHPSRGALAKHTLVTPSKKTITSSAESQGISTMSESDTKRFWCRTCRSEYSSTGKDVQIHSKHDTTTLREAKLQMMTEMKKKALDLEQTKRRFSDMVANAYDSIKHFEEDVQRKSIEIKNHADKMREQILLNERKSLTTLKEDAASKIEKRQSQIDTGKQHLTEISHILQDIGVTLEESNDNISMKKMSEIEEKVQKVQGQQLEIDSSEINVTSDGLSNLTESLETIQSVGIEKTERAKAHTDINSTEIFTSPVSIITAEPILNMDYGVVELKWTAVPGYTMDIKLRSVTEEGLPTVYYIYDVPGDKLTVDRLQFCTFYDVSVTIHNQPLTESKIHKFRTLPWINCPEFSLNHRKGHISIECSPCGKMAVHELTEGWHEDRLEKLLATVGTYEIEFGHMYWEVKATFKIPNKNKDYVFDLGICYADKVDRIEDLYKNYNAYACNLVKRGKRGHMSLEFAMEGKDDNTITYSFFNTESIHFGFFLNMAKREFSIIDTVKNEVYYKFNNIKNNGVYVPVFGLVPWRYDTELKLLTGSQILKVPSVVASLIDV